MDDLRWTAWAVIITVDAAECVVVQFHFLQFVGVAELTRAQVFFSVVSPFDSRVFDRDISDAVLLAGQCRYPFTSFSRSPFRSLLLR